MSSEQQQGDVRTYRGTAVDELLPKIREELGPDAVVVGRRESLSGGVGGFFQRREIELDVLVGGGAPAGGATASGSRPGSGLGPAGAGAPRATRLDVRDGDDAYPEEEYEPDAYRAAHPFAQHLARLTEVLPPNPAVGPHADPAVSDLPRPGEGPPRGMDELAEAFRKGLAAPLEGGRPEPEDQEPVRERLWQREAPEGAPAQPEPLAREVAPDVVPAPEAVFAPEGAEPAPLAAAPEEEVVDAELPPLPERAAEAPHAVLPPLPPLPPVPAAARPEPEAVAVEPDPEPVVVEPEPVVEAPEPAFAPDPEPVAVAPEPEPVWEPAAVPEPEPVARTPEPMPEPQPIAQTVPEPRRAEPSQEVDALVGRGLSEAFARSVVNHTVTHALPFAEDQGLDGLLREALASRIPVGTPPREGPGGVLVFVGPGGSGKTRAVARLATAYATRSPLPVACVALRPKDGGEELRRLLSSVGVAIHMEEHAGAAARRVEELRVDHLVLVDTPAVSPRDPDGVASLGGELAQLAADEVHLAVPATMGAGAARGLVAGLRGLGVDALALTHADETDQLGTGVELAIDTGLPLSYVALERGLRPAVAGDLARELLGGAG